VGNDPWRGLILSILLDAFETIRLPRRVQRGFGSLLCFTAYMEAMGRASQYIRKAFGREIFSATLGRCPLIVPARVLAVADIGFAFVQYGLATICKLTGEKITRWISALSQRRDFFTLGYGDIIAQQHCRSGAGGDGSGHGFAFLVSSSDICRWLFGVHAREIEISLLDARAGSPPSAAEFLAGWVVCPEQTVLDDIFRDWSAGARIFCPHIS